MKFVAAKKWYILVFDAYMNDDLKHVENELRMVANITSYN